MFAHYPLLPNVILKHLLVSIKVLSMYSAGHPSPCSPTELEEASFYHLSIYSFKICLKEAVLPSLPKILPRYFLAHQCPPTGSLTTQKSSFLFCVSLSSCLLCATSKTLPNPLLGAGEAHSSWAVGYSYSLSGLLTHSQSSFQNTLLYLITASLECIAPNLFPWGAT